MAGISPFKTAWKNARDAGKSMFQFTDGKWYSTRDKDAKDNEESDETWFKAANISTAEQDNFNQFRNYKISSMYDPDKNTYGGWEKDDSFKQGYTLGLNNKPAPEVDNTTTSNDNAFPAVSTTTTLPEFSKKQMMDLNFKDFNSLQSIAMDSRNKDNPFIVNMKGLFGDDPSKWDKNYVEGNLGVSGTYRGKWLGDYGDMFRSVNRLAQYKNRPNQQTPTTGTSTVTESQQTTQPSIDDNTYVSLGADNNEGSTTSGGSFSSNDYAQKLVNWLRLISKNQQGGKMNQKQIQQMFVQYLAKKSGAKTQEELQQYIQQLGKEGLQKEYAQFMQLLQNQSAQKAKHGAKLNMIARLNGITCPEGEELIYFQKGGKFCKKCIQRQQEMKAKFPQEAKTGTKFIKEFKYQIEASKCGSKMHK